MKELESRRFLQNRISGPNEWIQRLSSSSLNLSALGWPSVEDDSECSAVSGNRISRSSWRHSASVLRAWRIKTRTWIKKKTMMKKMPKWTTSVISKSSSSSSATPNIRTDKNSKKPNRSPWRETPEPSFLQKAFRQWVPYPPSQSLPDTPCLP